MNPKRVRSYLLVLMFLSLFPTIGQAQLSTYTPDQMSRALGIVVEIEGLREPISEIESVTGGAVALETSSISAGGDQFRSAITGLPFVEELTLRRRLTTRGGGVEEWLREVIEVGAQPRAVFATAVLRDGSPGPAIHYLEALPVRYVFPSLVGGDDGALYESLSVKPNRVEVPGGSGSVASSGGAAGMVETLQNGRFRVDGLPGDSPGVLSVSIGDLVFELIDAGGREYQTWRLGRSSVGPLTITLPKGRSPELADWWARVAQGREERREITVSVLDRGGEVARSFTFFECSPIKYDYREFSGASDVLTETITLSVGRVGFDR